MSDVEMIVIGHSQFERISMSTEYQQRQIEEDMETISMAISTAKEDKGQKYTVKQLEKQRENLKIRLQKLLDDSKKDKMITFDLLGVDSLVVDEAHYFKNCAIFSKMQNVSGINTAMAMKSSDMLMKTKYLSEKNGIVTFSTATPISNSMCELYVMQRYLQNEILYKKGMRHFDQWASVFGETVTALDVTPEGNGLRMKTKFANFINIPELMKMFCQVADVISPKDLDLPLPQLQGGKPIVVSVKPSVELEWFMKEGIKRVDRIRNRLVEPFEDNMLKFISDFKKAGLDMRLIDPDIPFDENGKLAILSKNIYEEYKNSNDFLGTQLIFSDKSTYNNSATFDVYRETKRLLTILGIPEEEIAFNHEAKNEKQKKDLFAKVRSGEIRILIGSTSKCGVGTNIQDKLIALHHIDCPYRPADIEQREGRIIRQGNKNKEVRIYRYVTERSFDAYLWNIVLNKQKFINQFLNGAYQGRRCEDVDDISLSFAEAQAIASGNPKIREKIELDNDLQRLNLLKSQYLNDKYTIQDKIDIHLPKRIAYLNLLISNIKEDKETALSNASDVFAMTIGKNTYQNREEAGEKLLQRIKALPFKVETNLGMYCGFELFGIKDDFLKVSILVKGKYAYELEGNIESNIGNVYRIENAIKNIPNLIEKNMQLLLEAEENLSTLKEEILKPFALEDELEMKLKRQMELNAELEVGVVDDTIVDDSDSSLEKEIETEIDM